MNLLDFLDAINWIDRIPGALIGLAIGGRHTFTIDRAANTGEQVEDVLARYDIRVFGRRITSKTAMLSVPKTRAKEAEYHLMRAGIMPLGKPLNPKNAGWASRHAGPTPAWKDRKR